MKKDILFILSITLIIFFVFSSCDSRNRQLIHTANNLIEKIETFRTSYKRIPDSLNELGIEEKMSGADTLFYSKISDLHYIVYFGDVLGESICYYSDTKQWKNGSMIINHKMWK